MNARQPFDVPNELELIEWFGCDTVKEDEKRYCYQFSDESNVTLIFSFDVIQASIQTIVTVAGAPVAKVVHESARKLWFQDLGKTRLLRAECLPGGTHTELMIEIQPRIRVEWSTLSV
ncbi:MAG TPA: hypothetical protein VK815_01595 [Candidatus Acidoferrales bacterium]|jgi:hypothetical protein|nr:hypothetical protein [Candidatus Acidoferrales bacterium]